MRTLFILLLLGLFLQSCSKETTSDSGQNLLKVGVSKAVINPPLGSFIAGDKQNRKFTGVLDSLYVKTFVAYDGSSSLALVTVDCIGLMYSDLLKVRSELTRMDFPIPFTPESLVISSTHTHSGPDVVGLWGKDYSESGVDPDYLEKLIKTIASEILKASQNLIEVEGKYAMTTHGDDWVKNISEEEIDRSITTLQFVDLDGNSIVSLTNFACHPTYLDGIVSEVSADYVGGFYKGLEDVFGGEHLFLQGAIGGWIQPNDKDGKHHTAIKRGEGLAEATINALKTQSEPLKNHQIIFRKSYVSFEVENEAWQQLAEMGIFNRSIGETVESEVAWFSIGEATFATHPGESAPHYSFQTKELMPQGPKLVLGLAQDALGYILKPEYFENPEIPHAPYLTSMSLGSKTGPRLMDELSALSKEE